MLSDARVRQSSAGRGSRSLLVRSRRASPYIVNRTLSWAVRTRRTPTDRMGTAAWLEHHVRSEEHTSELQSLMRISYAVFCLKTKNDHTLATSNPPITHVM